MRLALTFLQVSDAVGTYQVRRIFGRRWGEPGPSRLGVEENERGSVGKGSRAEGMPWGGFDPQAGEACSWHSLTLAGDESNKGASAKRDPFHT